MTYNTPPKVFVKEPSKFVKEFTIKKQSCQISPTTPYAQPGDTPIHYFVCEFLSKCRFKTTNA